MKVFIHSLFLMLALVVAAPSFAGQSAAPASATSTAPAFEESAPAKKSEIRAEKNRRPHELGDTQLIAGILGIVVGAFGIHKFILGYKKEGLIMLLVTVLTLGLGGLVMGIIGLIEGIIYLTMDESEFNATYVEGHKGWF